MDGVLSLNCPNFGDCLEVICPARVVCVSRLTRYAGTSSKCGGFLGVRGLPRSAGAFCTGTEGAAFR